jgi:hypothetical protein
VAQQPAIGTLLCVLPHAICLAAEAPFAELAGRFPRAIERRFTRRMSAAISHLATLEKAIDQALSAPPVFVSISRV